MKTFFLAFCSLFLLQLSAQDEEVVPVTQVPDTIGDGVLNFTVVEKLPVAPGCDTLGEAPSEDYMQCFQQFMVRHVSTHFRYPEEAQRQKVQAKIYVNFVIERDASVSNVEVVRGARDAYRGKDRNKRKAAEALDEEAVRVIKLLHFEKPAWQRGKPVRMSFTMPINARL